MQKKQIGHVVEQYKLDEEKEGRLGKLCNTAQWIIKIAQNRGAMACMIVKSVDYVGRKDGSFTMSIHTGDNQKLNLVFPGQWFSDAIQYFRPQQHHPFIISGAGSSIHPSSDKIIFSTGTCCIYILDISQVKISIQQSMWHGWLEASEGAITEHPTQCEIPLSVAGSDEESENDALKRSDLIASTSPQTRQILTPSNRVQPSDMPTPPEDVAEPKQRSQFNLSPNSSSRTAEEIERSRPLSLPAKRKSDGEENLSHNQDRRQRPSISSLEPDWLDTPAPERIERHSNVIKSTKTDMLSPLYGMVGSNGSSKSTPYHPSSTVGSRNSSKSAKISSKQAIAEALEQRIVGDYLITPICKVISTYKKQNTFGLVTSNEKVFRAAGGTGDFKLTVYVEDIFPLQGDKLSMTFNLFDSDEDSLPTCRAGDMLAIFNFATKKFNGAIQGVGYKGASWIVLSAETGKFTFSKSLQAVRPMLLCDEMRTHFDRMYKKMGTPAPVRSRGRRLMKLSEVEPSVFFDAEVQVISIWDGAHPCIYVTDYTTHPSLLLVQDVRLNSYSQDSLKIQMENNRSEGGGRVMPVYVWEDYTGIMDDIKAGDYLSLRNVRPKLNPAGFLEGNMGDKDSPYPSKINMYKITDENVIEAIEERRKAYQEEAVITNVETAFEEKNRTPTSTAKRSTIRYGSPDWPSDDASDDVQSSKSSPTTGSNDHTSAGKNTQESNLRNWQTPKVLQASFDDMLLAKSSDKMSSENGKLVTLNQELQNFSASNLEDVMQMEPRSAGDSELYRCRVRIRGQTNPLRMRDWVKVDCLKCKVT